MKERPDDLRWKELGSRTNWGEAREPVFGPLRLEGSRILHNTTTGESKKLDPKEGLVLWLLMRAQGNPVLCSELHLFLYRDKERNQRPDSNVISSYIGLLRASLRKLTGDRVTVVHMGRNDGYKLEIKD